MFFDDLGGCQRQTVERLEDTRACERKWAIRLLHARTSVTSSALRQIPGTYDGVSEDV